MGDDLFQWPSDRPPDLRDGLVPKDVIDALYAPRTIRMDNRVPGSAPTFQAVCAPTDGLRLIVVVCDRLGVEDSWTIRGAREATDGEQKMWRERIA